ncbi:MAG: transcriptional repressor [Synechococcus sp. SB0668_bin_15]|nr:transcriptional repressor [Synechococcus sp. SB0668_bin_15]MYC50206.1 transcriptional repressor [Synechococcus sp. SB0662_bin_14]
MTTSAPESPTAHLGLQQSLQGAIDRCAAVGLRMSHQRRLVLELLWKEQEHLSARDVFERINTRERRSIGQTSVYQNLETLQKFGIIECLERSGGRLYSYRADAHSHLICSATGRIQDLNVQLPGDLLAEIEARTGYRITSFTMQLMGEPLRDPPKPANP